MNVRLESLSSYSAPTEYVSFLTQATRPKGRSPDEDSLHSVSSVRSVASTVSNMFSSFGISTNSLAKEEKRKAAEHEDIRYLYSAFTKIPVLKLVLDHRVRRIKDFEEFPFDTAVPLWAFKNLSVLEVVDLDFRSFYGWDRLAEQLRSLTCKRCGLEDLADLLTNVVLDDMDQRRKRSAKTLTSPVTASNAFSPAKRYAELARTSSTPDSLTRATHSSSEDPAEASSQAGSTNNSRPATRPGLYGVSPSHSSVRTGSFNTPKYGMKPRRSSSSSSGTNHRQTPRMSLSNLLASRGLPESKWRFLRHLCVADNGFTSITSQSLHPLAQSLQSLDLSSNLFSELPDALATLVSLRALNMANCMIDSLHSLARYPLPTITVLNLRSNRLRSLAGIEKLPSLERLELRGNRLTDPTELARLTGMPNLREIFVQKNPFTKTHAGSYRVSIFNLFRKSAGYTDDIRIDGTGPSYTEKKYLVDRVPESRHVPTVKPPPQQDGDAATNEIHTEESVTTDHLKSESPRTPSKPSSIKPTRKVARRRVVDLSESPKTPTSTNSDGASPEVQYVTALQSPGTAARRRVEAEHDVTPCRPKSREQATNHQPDDSPVPTSAGRAELRPTIKADMSLSGEQYRKRIESLKREYGASWLSVLGNDSDPFIPRETPASPGAMT